MQLTQFIEYAVAGIVAYGYLGTKPVYLKITSPEQDQTIGYKSFPSILQVSGSSINPTAIKFYSGSALIDSATVSGNFTASLTVEGPGPHDIVFSSVDSQGNTVSQTLSVTVVDTSVQPPVYALSDYRGVNWISPILSNAGTTVSNPGEIARRMQRLKEDKHNFIRLPWRMGVFESNRDRCVTEIDNILTAADSAGIGVQLDFHVNRLPNQTDLPSTFLANYSSITIYKFFQDFITNKVSGVLNAWGKIWDAWKYILDRVKDHPSLRGVELWNEPKFPPTDAAKGLGTAQAIHQAWGNFYTELATKIRVAYGHELYVLICEGNMTKLSDEGADGIAQSGNSGTFGLLFPKQIPNIAYGWHRYRIVDPNDATNTPRASILQGEIDKTNALILTLPDQGVDFAGDMCQEWAVGTPSGNFKGSPNNLISMRIFMNVFKQNNKGWSYWAAFGESLGDGRVMYIKNAADPTGWIPNNSGSIDGTGEGVNFFTARKEAYGY